MFQKKCSCHITLKKRGDPGARGLTKPKGVAFNAGPTRTLLPPNPSLSSNHSRRKSFQLTFSIRARAFRVCQQSHSAEECRLSHCATLLVKANPSSYLQKKNSCPDCYLLGSLGLRLKRLAPRHPCCQKGQTDLTQFLLRNEWLTLQTTQATSCVVYLVICNIGAPHRFASSAVEYV